MRRMRSMKKRMRSRQSRLGNVMTHVPVIGGNRDGGGMNGSGRTWSSTMECPDSDINAGRDAMETGRDGTSNKGEDIVHRMHIQLAIFLRLCRTSH
jgi:hypothetical protein